MKKPALIFVCVLAFSVGFWGESFVIRETDETDESVQSSKESNPHQIEENEENVKIFRLKEDEVWPHDVAHIFTGEESEHGKEAEREEEGKEREKEREEKERIGEGKESGEGEGEEADFNGRRSRRSEPGVPWTGKWPQRWSEEGNATLRKPAPSEDSFVFYYRPEDDTYVMSRCTSTVGAPVLTIACPQPRGYPFHRIVDLKTVYYGWSMTADACQFVEGDCTIPYEFMHKQIIRPTKPVLESDFYSLGPTYFCNPWDGGGREEWVLPSKMKCTIGTRRSTSVPSPRDFNENPFGQRFGYSWGYCGTPYDWFDFIQAEYKCVDVMEALEGAHEAPEEFFGCEARAEKLKAEAEEKARAKAKTDTEDKDAS